MTWQERPRCWRCDEFLPLYADSNRCVPCQDAFTNPRSKPAVKVSPPQPPGRPCRYCGIVDCPTDALCYGV